MIKGEILKRVAINEVFSPIQTLSQPMLKYIFHNEMPFCQLDLGTFLWLELSVHS